MEEKAWIYKSLPQNFYLGLWSKSIPKRSQNSLSSFLKNLFLCFESRYFKKQTFNAQNEANFCLGTSHLQNDISFILVSSIFLTFDSILCRQFMWIFTKFYPQKIEFKDYCMIFAKVLDFFARLMILLYFKLITCFIILKALYWNFIHMLKVYKISMYLSFFIKQLEVLSNSEQQGNHLVIVNKLLAMLLVCA